METAQLDEIYRKLCFSVVTSYLVVRREDVDRNLRLLRRKGNSWKPYLPFSTPSKTIERKEKIVEKLARKVEKKNVPDFYKRRFSSLKLEYQLAKRINKRGFTRIARDIYGDVDEKLFKVAERYARKEEKKTSAILPKKKEREIVAMLKRFRWEVVFSDVARCHVDVFRKRLVIPLNELYDEAELLAIISHELVHILRHENGLKLPYKILAYPSSFVVSAEEGLAVVVEREKAGRISSVKVRAGYVISCFKRKCKESWFNIFNELVENYGLNKRSAMKVILRTARGACKDRFGYFPKDICYIKGYERVRRMRKSAREYLFAGKIDTSEVASVREIVEERGIKIFKV